MKNNLLLYNLKGIARMLTPELLLPKNREKLLQGVAERKDIEYIKSRVEYYCQLQAPVRLDSSAWELRDLRFTRKKSVYFFDSYEFARYFPQDFRAHFEFGDVNYICPKPSITKSRPIQARLESRALSHPTHLRAQDSKRADTHALDFLNSAESSADSTTPPLPPFANSTLLNLEKNRHFIFINDPYSFESKRDILFYRGGIYQDHRTRFFEKYFNHPLCDLGHTGSKSVHHAWQKEKISIKKHLPYKFLLSLEGNDVASNLKWVMSSNSLAVMPEPKFETWFMEGRLLPDVHYLRIAEDYANLEECIESCLRDEGLAREIIHNAHEYVKQFFDKEREAIISLLVLEKYFYYTGQIDKLRI